MPMLSHFEPILDDSKPTVEWVTKASFNLFSPTPVVAKAPKSDGSDDRDEEPREQQEQGEERKIHKIMMMTDLLELSWAILK